MRLENNFFKTQDNVTVNKREEKLKVVLQKSVDAWFCKWKILLSLFGLCAFLKFVVVISHKPHDNFIPNVFVFVTRFASGHEI